MLEHSRGKQQLRRLEGPPIVHLEHSPHPLTYNCHSANFRLGGRSLHISRPLLATVLFPVLIALPASLHAQDKSAAKPAAAEKPAEATLPADSTTQGSVVVSGQRIDYTAVAGIITVGATDTEDA